MRPLHTVTLRHQHFGHPEPVEGCSSSSACHLSPGASAGSTQAHADWIGSLSIPEGVRLSLSKPPSPFVELRVQRMRARVPQCLLIEGPSSNETQCLAIPSHRQQPVAWQPAAPPPWPSPGGGGNGFCLGPRLCIGEPRSAARGPGFERPVWSASFYGTSAGPRFVPALGDAPREAAKALVTSRATRRSPLPAIAGPLPVRAAA